MSGWRTIESDEGVFTQLVEKLGVEGVEFSEVLTLDELNSGEEPIYGAIFLFKYENNEKSNQDDDKIDGKYDYNYMDRSNDLVFTRQVVNNACGTIGVISILLSKADEIKDLGPRLKYYREFINGMDGEMVGETLAMSEDIKEIHNSLSAEEPVFMSNDEEQQQKQGDGDDIFHFVGYTYANGRLYELNGLNPAPIDHGPARDMKEFRKNLVNVLERRIAKYPSSELRFNLVKVIQDQRIELEKVGDLVGLRMENEKRARWRRETYLRQSNFTGLIMELLKKRQVK